MQLAFVNNDKIEAFPKGRGICPLCGSETIAKCGPRMLHHWAHYRGTNCDSWWENETLWHREWKNKFPVNCREVSYKATNGEIHRADIRTPSGIILEIQHSSITDKERISRELFYNNLIWIVDGSKFRNNFYILHKLPDPKSALAQDLVWIKGKKSMNGTKSGLFFRVSDAIKENPLVTKATLNGGWLYGAHLIEAAILDNYTGYHQYDWVKPRKIWLDASCPVYIDFGNEYLLNLTKYDSSNLMCVKYISKDLFIKDVMTKKFSNQIGRVLQPIHEIDLT